MKAISYNNKINLFGIEKSKLMLNKAKARLQFCKVKNNIELKFLKSNNQIPFKSFSFDKIYANQFLQSKKMKNCLKLLLNYIEY